jgi:ribosomal protein S18 acetylase RimI-like enzyme
LRDAARAEHKAAVLASTSTIDVRLAEPSDIRTIGRFMLSAAAGLYDYLLGDLVDGLSTSDILALVIAEEGSAYFYGNALLASEGGRERGMSLAFPGAELGLPEAARTLVPSERLAAMDALIDTADAASLYLNSLAVDPAFGRRGVGRLLLETTAAMAVTRGFARMSLHVWTDNAPAMALYRSLGFEVSALIDMPPSPAFTHRGPVAAASADIADVLDQLARP